MAYTQLELEAAFKNAAIGTSPTAAQSLTLQAIATQNASGQITNDQAMSQTTNLAANGTTDVSVGAYQFFLGFAPSVAGLTSLNAAYTGTGAQAGLNGENRFIAQSVSLALANTAAKAAFTASYGALSVKDATAAAYNIIVGNPAAVAAGVDVAAAVNYLSSAATVAYYTNFIKQNVPGLNAADLDLAVKAAIVGEILYIADSYNNGAGLGSYATSTNNLVTDLANDGKLNADNAAGINLFTAYPGPQQVVNTTLTTGVDTIVGTSANDVITGFAAAAASNPTLTPLDSIDGGAGSDTLQISDLNGSANLGGLTVKNVETLTYVSAAGITSGAANVSGYTGLTSATFSLTTTEALDTFTAADTTAVTVVAGVDTTADAITVNGGSTVSVTANIADGQTAGAVTVAGAATSVTVTENKAGVAATGVAGTVAISDTGVSATKAGTLASVTLSGTGAATIASNALTTLTLAGAGTVGLTNSLTTPTNTALTLNISGTNGALTDVNNEIKTLNVNATGTATLANILDTGLTALNVSGSKVLTLTSAAGATNLKTVTVTGTAGLVATVNQASVTSVDTTGTTGASTITLDATKATFTGGAGNDTVVVAAAPTKALVGGTGTDTFVANIAGGFAASANGNISGFETLGLGALATGTFDSTGFTNLSVANAVAAAVTFSNVAVGAGLTITAAPTFGVTAALADSSGTADAFKLTVGSTSATGLALAGNAVTLTGFENLTVDSLTKTAGSVNTVQIVDANVKTIVVTGGADTTITGTATVSPSVDAHALTGAFTYTSTLATGTTTILGSATGVNTIAGAGAADTITGGAKADVLTSGQGLDVLTGGAGADSFVLSANVNGNTYATITDFTKTAGAVAGDTINLSGLIAATADAANATFATADHIQLASTAAFADYLNAATADTGPGTTAATADHITWFNYSGDTYIVIDNSTATTFQNGLGGDQVVKLTGTLDLTTATITAGVFGQ